MTVHVFIFQALFATYGVDWSGPPPSDVVSNDTVFVPDTNCPLTPTEMAELQSQYNPLGPCDDLSINMYFDVYTPVHNYKDQYKIIIITLN